MNDVAPSSRLHATSCVNILVFAVGGGCKHALRAFSPLGQYSQVPRRGVFLAGLPIPRVTGPREWPDLLTSSTAVPAAASFVLAKISISCFVALAL